MSKHNALQMFGRSGNPALNDNTFMNEGRVMGQTMTLQGTVNKTGFLLGILVLTAVYTWNLFFQTGNPAAVMPIAIGGAIGGFIMALVTIFKKTWSPITAPIYAALEGLFLGGISAIFEYQYPGIVIQATGLTLGTLASLLVLYKLGIIKPTENFRLMIVSATMGIGVLYLISMIMNMFGSTGIGFIHSNGLFGIGFSLFVVAIAALNLVLDFDFIEQGAEMGAPKYMEWFGAFSLMVTLIWLYLEMLRLLAKLRSR
ncbi:MAG: Bax inhibitor-1/YccA family protein [Woeseiaceae bacterium]|nr:Bax inhibitor-1/YccA family protein [Woeseiaceae bacterium]|tara:strand:+ start:1283 stop:2053 length:771 start_codon:yes stop_codon:yes gene_type:complete